jgi:hypothetical protein
MGQRLHPGRPGTGDQYNYPQNADGRADREREEDHQQQWHRVSPFRRNAVRFAGQNTAVAGPFASAEEDNAFGVARSTLSENL